MLAVSPQHHHWSLCAADIHHGFSSLFLLPMCDRLSYPVNMVYNHQKSNPLHLRNSLHYSSLKNKKIPKTKEPAKLQNASTIYYQNQNAWSKNKCGESCLNPNVKLIWCFSNYLYITIFQVFLSSVLGILSYSNSHTVYSHALCNFLVSLGMWWPFFILDDFGKLEFGSYSIINGENMQ